tara:strand:- start:252 stop:422 length:171 start_codon:yes stop_codon:yes gene_type:complete
LSDLPGIKASGSLIGHGREVVAVENDYFSRLERRINEGLYMFLSILVKQVQFLLCG